MNHKILSDQRYDEWKDKSKSENTSAIREGGKVKYIISNKTLAITSIESNYYRTKIYEEDDVIYSKESPLTIIENSCLHYGSSLQGRKDASKHILKSNSKLPITITPHHKLFILPTKSHRNKECVWFSYYHVEDYIKIEDRLAVLLSNYNVMNINISFNQFDMQMKRTSQLIAYYFKLHRD